MGYTEGLLLEGEPRVGVYIMENTMVGGGGWPFEKKRKMTIMGKK